MALFDFQSGRLQRPSLGLLELMHYSADDNPTCESLCKHLVTLCTNIELRGRAELALNDLLSNIQQLTEGDISQTECALVVPSIQVPLEGRWLRVQISHWGDCLVWLIDEPNRDAVPPQRMLRKGKYRSRKEKPWDSASSHFTFKTNTRGSG